MTTESHFISHPRAGAFPFYTRAAVEYRGAFYKPNPAGGPWIEDTSHYPLNCYYYVARRNQLFAPKIIYGGAPGFEPNQQDDALRGYGSPSKIPVSASDPGYLPVKLSREQIMSLMFGAAKYRVRARMTAIGQQVNASHFDYDANTPVFDYQEKMLNLEVDGVMDTLDYSKGWSLAYMINGRMGTGRYDLLKPHPDYSAPNPVGAAGVLRGLPLMVETYGAQMLRWRHQPDNPQSREERFAGGRAAGSWITTAASDLQCSLSFSVLDWGYIDNDGFYHVAVGISVGSPLVGSPIIPLLSLNRWELEAITWKGPQEELPPAQWEHPTITQVGTAEIFGCKDIPIWSADWSVMPDSPYIWKNPAIPANPFTCSIRNEITHEVFTRDFQPSMTFPAFNFLKIEVSEYNPQFASWLPQAQRPG